MKKLTTVFDIKSTPELVQVPSVRFYYHLKHRGLLLLHVPLSRGRRVEGWQIAHERTRKGSEMDWVDPGKYEERKGWGVHLEKWYCQCGWSGATQKAACPSVGLYGGVRMFGWELIKKGRPDCKMFAGRYIGRRRWGINNVNRRQWWGRRVVAQADEPRTSPLQPSFIFTNTFIYSDLAQHCQSPTLSQQGH